MKELIIMCALPGAGKSTLVEKYKTKGYTVLSRDVEGGDTSKLVKELYYLIDSGHSKIILDNTATTKESRKQFVDVGKQAGFKVICLHLTTSMEDAQVNTVTRMIRRHGKLFRTAEDYKSCKDPNAFPPAALFSAKKHFEKPEVSEGFNDIITEKFVRIHNGYTNKAVILDYDGTLRRTKSGNIYPKHPDDVTVLQNHKERLLEYLAKGYILLGASNQSGIGKGDLTEAQAVACFERTNELLGLKIDYTFCPHKVPPITCFCRKPSVGIGVEFIEKYKLDPSQTIMVGDMTSDKTFATRCGFTYVEAETFFK